MRKQVQDMEEEARKLAEMQESIQSDVPNKEEVDQRSIFVGNVRFILIFPRSKAFLAIASAAFVYRSPESLHSHSDFAH